MTALHYTGYTKNSEEVADAIMTAKIAVDFPVDRKVWRSTWIHGRQAWEPKSDPHIPQLALSSNRGLTPLHFAALYGSVKMTEYFIKRGADPNARSHYGETPLHFALGKAPSGPKENGNKDHWNDSRYRIEDWLDNYDYTSEDETEYGETKSALERMRLQIVEAFLFHENIDLDVKCDQGLGILHCLSYQQDGFQSTDILPRILSKDVTGDAHDSEGQTALHLACRASNARAVQLLINKGADVMAIDHRGLHSLHHAAHSSDLLTLKTILRDVNDSGRTLPDLRDARGWNPLHHLLAGNYREWTCHAEAIDFLIANGSSVNQLSNEEESPLAVQLSRFFVNGRRIARMARHLFSAGADAFYRTPDEGRNYGHLAAAKLNKLDIEVLEALQDHGVRLADKDERGRTILHHCALAGSLASSEVMKFLCESVGLSPTTRDESGQSPLDIAQKLSEKSPYRTFRPERWDITLKLLTSYPGAAPLDESEPESNLDASNPRERCVQGDIDSPS
ncbi:ankyrin [Dissoconium aciculare CBS 342.82]|uniref:Ankyrin n=1 Tax=Dissoconium aciculare CBS 342.82 TaxID=1314786 RepID=A0A6J3MBE1_9PEZI|nr:ankyrin [Dissoconium aciculare CBS 342.82]KAF1825178.1 ankyrin [Dissoconium aciculare CBS 342.82]